MCDGLEAISATPGYGVDMATFGASDGYVCYACAATCAAMQATGKRLAPDEIRSTAARAKVYEADWITLDSFEMAMENARCGRLRGLFLFFDVPLTEMTDTLEVADWHLSSLEWDEDIPKVRKGIELLRSVGL